MSPDTLLIDGYDAFGFGRAHLSIADFETVLQRRLSGDGLTVPGSAVRQRCQRAARRAWWNERSKRFGVQPTAAKF